MPDRNALDDAAALRAPTVRLPVAVLTVLAAVVVALLAVWGTTVLDADRLPTGPALDPPAAPPEPTTMAKTGDRQVRFREFSMTLPASPFDCSAGVYPRSPLFDQMTYCTAVTQRGVGRKHLTDWSAEIGVGVLSEQAVKPGELSKTVVAALPDLVEHSYDEADRARITHARVSTVRVSAPVGSTSSYEAHVEVSVAGLTSPYDKAVLVGIELASGRTLLLYSLFPHEGGDKELPLLVDSIQSVAVKG